MKILFNQPFNIPKTLKTENNKKYNNIHTNKNIYDTFSLTNGKKTIAFSATKSTKDTNITEYTKLESVNPNDYKHIKNKQLIECLNNLNAEPEKLIKSVENLSSSLPDKSAWTKRTEGNHTWLEYIDTDGQKYEKHPKAETFFTEVELKTTKNSSIFLSILKLPLRNAIKYSFDLVKDDKYDSHYMDTRTITIKSDSKKIINDYNWNQ